MKKMSLVLVSELWKEDLKPPRGVEEVVLETSAANEKVEILKEKAMEDQDIGEGEDEDEEVGEDEDETDEYVNESHNNTNDECDNETTQKKMLSDFPVDTSIPKKDTDIWKGDGWKVVKCGCKEQRHFVWTSTPPSMEPGYEWEIDIPPLTISSGSGSFVESVNNEAALTIRSIQSFGDQETATTDFKQLLDFKDPKKKKDKQIRESTSLLFRCPYCSRNYTRSNGLIRHFQVHKDEILKGFSGKGNSAGNKKKKRKVSYDGNKAPFSIPAKVKPPKVQKGKKGKLIPCSVMLTRCDYLIPNGKLPGTGPEGNSKSSNNSKSPPRKKVSSPRPAPHSCIFCGKGFQSSNHLESHILTHTKEKPYSCPVCGKCFPRKDTVMNHLQLHNNAEKFHQCHICWKRFRRPWGLKLHSFRHTGERNWVCPICGKRFRQPGTLRKHKKRRHQQSSSSLQNMTDDKQKEGEIVE